MTKPTLDLPPEAARLLTLLSMDLDGRDAQFHAWHEALVLVAGIFTGVATSRDAAAGPRAQAALALGIHHHKTLHQQAAPAQAKH